MHGTCSKSQRRARPCLGQAMAWAASAPSQPHTGPPHCGAEAARNENCQNGDAGMGGGERRSGRMTGRRLMSTTVFGMMATVI
eukprot:9493341-Pyramimonas_sp.AAC.1